jgi:isoleucyl-tRNA synthetase
MLLVTRDAGDQASLLEFGDAIRQELNVKELKFSADEKSYVRLVLKPNWKVLGPKLGKNLGVIRQELERIAGSQEESFRLIDGMETGAKVQVGPEHLGLDDLFVTREVLSADAFATDAGVTVILDTKLSPELIREGIAREYVNRVQNHRKDSGLQVSDRISLKVTASSQDHIQALKEHEEYLKSEVLAANVEFAVGLGLGEGIDLEDSKAWIEIRKL